MIEIFSFCVSIADLISIAGIIANIFLAIYIVRVIQNRLTNNRVLKDHFIKELLSIREIYGKKLDSIYRDKCEIKSLIPWFKLMNIKTENLMDLISAKYGIESTLLYPYQIELRALILDSDDFTEKFNSETLLEPSNELRSNLFRFQQMHNHLFNDLIVLINDCKK